MCHPPNLAFSVGLRLQQSFLYLCGFPLSLGDLHVAEVTEVLGQSSQRINWVLRGM